LEELIGFLCEGAAADQKSRAEQRKAHRQDARTVQQQGGHREAQRKGKQTDRRMHLLAVGKAVKEAEKDDDKQTEGRPETDFADNDRAENGDGQQNYRFGAGHIKAACSGESPQAHHNDERERKPPDGMAPPLRRPHADRQHGQKMIPAVQGVIKSVLPAAQRGAGRMGMG
jgi:hypothetical protein